MERTVKISTDQNTPKKEFCPPSRAVSNHGEVCGKPVSVSGEKQGMKWNQYSKNATSMKKVSNLW